MYTHAMCVCIYIYIYIYEFAHPVVKRATRNTHVDITLR